MNPILKVRSIIEALNYRAGANPERKIFSFIGRKTEITESLTYLQLQSRSQTIANLLLEKKLTGQPIILLYHSDLRFIEAFFACLMAGAIAVPVPLPLTTRHRSRLSKIIENSGAKFALTTQEIKNSILNDSSASGPDQFLNLQLIQSQSTGFGEILKSSSFKELDIDENSTAFIQYTSGSTGQPKGVMVSHKNIITNSHMMCVATGVSFEDETLVSWLPLYHDMGLMGPVLCSLYAGLHSLLMPPHSIVRPAQWLKVITQNHATISPAPNFAFSLCCRKITEEERASIDLSSIKMWICGAEPISVGNLQHFTSTFEKQGARFDQFTPCFGLAEATVCVSAPHFNSAKIFGARPRTHSIHKLNFFPSERSGPQIMACGSPLPQTEILIVNPETRSSVPNEQVGEIWVRGDHVAKGYWKNEEATQITFRGQVHGRNEFFLRTGDLGFFREGQLYVVGRIKNMMILRGQNIYPMDLEELTKECHPLLRNSVCAAIASLEDGEESLVIVTELSWHIKSGKLKELEALIRKNIREEFGLDLKEWAATIPGGIPKTANGKIRYSELAKQYQNGTLTEFNSLEKYWKRTLQLKNRAQLWLMLNKTP